MKKSKVKRSPKVSPLILGLLGIVLLSGLIFGGYQLYKSHNKKSSTYTTADGQTINLNPPTQDEKTQTDTHKEEITNNQPVNDKTQPTQQQPSTIVFTQISSSGVRAYVTGVFEEGGTCTATATQGHTVITKTSTGFQNASYTQCAPINWDAPLSSGSWLVTLVYKSSATQSTGSQTLQVP